MKALKIILLGATGQVGYELHRSLAVLGQVVVLTRDDLDFRNPVNIKAKIETLAPDVIVNGIAWTAVDDAEDHESDTFNLNAQLPEMLAHSAQSCGAWLVHFSSDYVYSGEGSVPRTESDVTEPLSVYGRSKLAGDQAIQKNCDKHLIFRTSWVYSVRRNNFLLTMLRLGMQRDNLKVVADQIGAPTPARLIAEVTAMVLHKVLSSSQNKSGIYHLCPRGETSWYGFADAIFTLGQQYNLPLIINDNGLAKIASSEYPVKATRPFNSRLSVDKLEQTFNLTMPCWQSQLALTFDELVSSSARAILK